MPQDFIGDIRDFHEKFGLAYHGPSRELPEEFALFRLRFMVEELAEYAGDFTDEEVKGLQRFFADHRFTAVTLNEKANKLDAMVDLMYVLLGTVYLHGWGNVFEEAWRRVHAANMSKTRASAVDESKRASIYDVVKPEGWRPPSLLDLV